MMFLGLRKLGIIYGGHEMFLNRVRNIFCVRNKCCGRGQTGKHLCRQQCVRNNVSSFARAFRPSRIGRREVCFSRGERVNRHNKLENRIFICKGFEKIILQIIASNTLTNKMRLGMNPPSYRKTQFYELNS